MEVVGARLPFGGRWLCDRANGITRSHRRIAQFKDKHKGRRGFIVATGPSLQVSDLDKLQDEITFSCNKIYLAFERTCWRPTYYSVIDVMVAENNRGMIRGLKLEKFLASGLKPGFRCCRDIIWVEELPDPIVQGSSRCGFSKDLQAGAHGGASVVYTLLQMAYYMGIREVYLLGLDFSFKVPASTGEVCVHGEILKGQGEVNHFDPRYRGAGEKWTMPRLDLQYEAFSCAKQVFEQDGRMIYNASRATSLDVFPRVNLDDILR